MENANPFILVTPNRLHARITQELNELRAILAMIDSRLENIDHTQIIIPPLVPIDQLFNDFMDSPDALEMDDLESDNGNCRKAYLLEEKQIPSVGVFDEVSFYTLFQAFQKHLKEKHVTWARFEKKLDKNTTLQDCDFHYDAFTKSIQKVKFLIKVVTSQAAEKASEITPDAVKIKE
ncbi:hypothetical protein Tco_0866828 [Tanacetum coccineum]